MVFNKDGKLIAAQWTADTRAWIEIGEVTGNGDGGNINGEQFDHIMPVEIDGAGGTTLSLQLGYNNMENPYEAAQRFIDQNSLPQHYLKQIADWIVSRAGKQTPSLGASDTSSNTPSVRHYQHIPVKAYLVHDEIPPSFKSKIISKMSEFNTTYAGTHSLLSESEITVISDLIGVLEETSFYHSSTIDATLLAPVVKMAIHWDASKAFPAFDILRMTALHSAGSRSIASLPHFAKLFDRIVTIVSDPTATASTVLTALRFLGNAFRYEELKRSVLKFGISKMSALLDSLQSLLYTNKSNNKSIRIAASILALNLSVAMNLTSLQSYSIDPYLPVCLKLIQHLSSWLTLETESSEFIYRYIVSVGTLVLTNKAFSGEVVSTCVTAGLQTMLTLLSTMGTTDAIKQSAAEVLSLF